MKSVENNAQIFIDFFRQYYQQNVEGNHFVTKRIYLFLVSNNTTIVNYKNIFFTSSERFIRLVFPYFSIDTIFFIFISFNIL